MQRLACFGLWLLERLVSCPPPLATLHQTRRPQAPHTEGEEQLRSWLDGFLPVRGLLQTEDVSGGGESFGLTPRPTVLLQTYAGPILGWNSVAIRLQGWRISKKRKEKKRKWRKSGCLLRLTASERKAVGCGLEACRLASDASRKGQASAGWPRMGASSVRARLTGETKGDCPIGGQANMFVFISPWVIITSGQQQQNKKTFAVP